MAASRRGVAARATVRPLRAGRAREGARTKRGRSRREMILAAAAELFRKHGFHATGIDDIGAAVGITGPGVYRHFTGKHDVLAAVMERAIEGHQRIVEEALRTARSPQEALERFVAGSAELLVQHRDLTAIYFQEMRNLSPRDRTRLGEMQRLLIDEWVHALTQVRPELAEEEARVIVRAVGGLLNSLAYYHSTLEPDRLKELLAAMAMAALHAPVRRRRGR